MKKGCLIVLAVLLILGLSGAGFAYYTYRSYVAQYGLEPATAISHEQLTADNTRIKAVVKTEYVKDYLLGLIPPDLNTRIPWISWLPFTTEDIVNGTLPYEMAILAGADYTNSRMDVTVFVNEKMGGPAMVQAINEINLQKSLSFINWSETGFALPERGMLTGGGTIDIPEEVQSVVQGIYNPKSGPSEAHITGQNLAEILIDNRDGDAAAVVGMIVEKMGPEGLDGATPSQVLNSQEFRVFLKAIQEASLAANITGPDEITFDIRIATAEGTGLMERIVIIGGINDRAYKALKAFCAQNNMTFDFKEGAQPNWDPKGTGVLSGSFVLSGFRARIEQQIDAALAGLN